VGLAPLPPVLSTAKQPASASLVLSNAAQLASATLVLSTAKQPACASLVLSNPAQLASATLVLSTAKHPAPASLVLHDPTRPAPGSHVSLHTVRLAARFSPSPQYSRNPHDGHDRGPFANSVQHAGHVNLSASRSTTVSADFLASGSSSDNQFSSMCPSAARTSWPATASHSFVPQELHFSLGGETISPSMPCSESDPFKRRK